MQDSILSKVSSAALDGRMRVLRIRQFQLKSLHDYLREHTDELLEAMQSDEGYTVEEARLILIAALIDIRNHYDKLDLKQELKLEYSIANGKGCEERRLPIPIAYIVPDPYTLLFSVCSVLGAAIEAGCCCIIELENTRNKSSSLLRQYIAKSLDNEAIGIISSPAPTKFLSECIVVDQVGKFDNSSAAKPRKVLVSSESHNVAVVDRTGDFQLAAREVVSTQVLFGGCSRYKVHHVLVNEFQGHKLKQAILEEISKLKITTGKPSTNGTTGRQKYLYKSENVAYQTLITEEVNNKNVQVVAETPAGTVLEVLNRASPLMKLRSTSQNIIIHEFTSLDDVIDVLNAGYPPLEALYLFAAPSEAKYLSQYIPSNLTVTNYVPAQLLTGPTTPLGFATSVTQRYTRLMFETPSPELGVGPRTHLASSLVSTKGPEKVAKMLSHATKPLKPTGQPPGGAWGFFEQGLVLGALVYLLPMLVASCAGIGYTAWLSYHKFLKP